MKNMGTCRSSLQQRGGASLMMTASFSMDHQKSSVNLNWGPCTTIWDLLMQRVISSMTECLLFINIAFILASLLKSIAELQFLIRDFLRTLKIFIVFVFPNLECGDSLCRQLSCSFCCVTCYYIFFFIFMMSWLIQKPRRTNPFD